MSGAGPAFDAERHLDAMSPVLGLVVAETQRPAVLQFLEVAHLMATIVQSAPLDDGVLELAAVFRPGHRDEGEPA